MNSIKKRLTSLITGMIVISLTGCSFSSTDKSAPDVSVSPTPSNSISTSKNNPNKVSENNTNESTQNQSIELKSSSIPTPTPTATPTPKITPKITPQPVKAENTDIETVTVTIYHIDDQCSTLVPKKIAVPKNNSLEAAIGKVLEEVNSGDFDLVGYRVNVNQKSGLATVDLRLSPDSQRKIVSLSNCEQFAIFGSIRKTLTGNKQWKVKDIRFTEKGKEIYL
ncbi:MAG: sporulation/spore germination protein [Moorea sp. SIO2B7]|nr:sporulation/spore germination protein [Moorena sp. SIO2B7]